MRRHAVIRCFVVLSLLLATCQTWAERNVSDIPDESTLDEDTRAVLNKLKRPADVKPEAWKSALDRYKIKMSRNAKVQFFGKVVDSDMQPLEGVQVSGFVRSYDSAYLNNPAAITSDQKEHEWAVTTDKKGRFTVRGLRGLSLHIRKLEKEGFLAPAYDEYFRISEKQFRKNVYKAKEDHPVVFKMWTKDKVGADINLIQKAIKVNGQSDGTEYRINLETGTCEVKNDAPFDIAIRIQSARSDADSKGKYDWSFSMTAVEGGFVATDELHAFEAPENGYVSPFTAVFLSADEKWSRKDQRTFYVQTRKGALHAKINLIIYAYGNGKTLVRINSVASSTGSRNLGKPFTINK